MHRSALIALVSPALALFACGTPSVGTQTPTEPEVPARDGRAPTDVLAPRAPDGGVADAAGPTTDASRDAQGGMGSQPDMNMGRADGAPAGGGNVGMITFDLPPESEPEPARPPCQREVAVTNDATFTTALAGAKPGDCLMLADGNYKGVKITAVGTALAPIVIRARNRLGAVISTGQLVLQSSAHLVLEGLTIRASGTMKLIDCQHCRITRCKFALTVEDDWLLIYGNASHHNRVDRCELGPKPTPGPFIVIGQEDTMSHHDRIDRNHFHDNGPAAVNEKESVRVGWSGVYQREGWVTVEHNLFENCDGDPEIVSVKTHRNIVRYNTVRTSAGVLSLRHGDGSWLYGNFILGGGKSVPCTDRQGRMTSCATGGIRIYGKGHRVFNNYIEATAGDGHRGALVLDGGDGTSADSHHVTSEAIVVANTLIDNASAIEIGPNYTTAPRDLVIAYNLVRGPSGRLVRVFKPAATVRYAGNLLWPTGGNDVGVVLGSNDARIMDPRLERMGELWRILPASPAIDGAAALGRVLPEDIDGQPRATADIGADEHATSQPLRRPLKASDVGPAAP